MLYAIICLFYYYSIKFKIQINKLIFQSVKINLLLILFLYNFTVRLYILNIKVTTIKSSTII